VTVHRYLDSAAGKVQVYKGWTSQLDTWQVNLPSQSIDWCTNGV